jgi:thiamine transporter ThiT
MTDALVGYLAGVVFGLGLWLTIEPASILTSHELHLQPILAFVFLMFGSAFLGAILGRKS